MDTVQNMAYQLLRIVKTFSTKETKKKKKKETQSEREGKKTQNEKGINTTKYSWSLSLQADSGIAFRKRIPCKRVYVR